MQMKGAEDRAWVADALVRLRETGHPLTSQREAVVRYLAGNEAHPSAAEVHESLPGASRSTVYKTLALLVRIGMADAVPAPTGELRFDPRTDEHDHFFCRSCGSLVDIPAGSVRVEVPSGYRVERQRVFAEGTCPACSP